MATTLLVAGTSLSSITSGGGTVTEQYWRGLFGHEYSVALPDLVSNTWPGVTATKVPREISVGLVLVGTSLANFHDVLAAVITACDSTSPVTLTRRIDTGAGQVSKTCSAIFLGGLDPTMESPNIGRVVPRWHMLSSDWA